MADLRQGRVELVLAGPLSWPSLIRQRLIALLAGAAAITVGAICGLIAGGLAVGAPLDALGLARVFADVLLFAAALGGLAALVVAWLRGTAGVSVLAVIVATSYLLMYLVPLFAWPDWVLRLSVFGALGNPYLEIPAVSGLAVLAVLAAAGTLLATTIAARSAKTV